MAGKSVKRPKKAARDQIVQVRTTVEQKQIFTDAATRKGLTLSAWVVTTCLSAARAERRKAEGEAERTE